KKRGPSEQIPEVEPTSSVRKAGGGTSQTTHNGRGAGRPPTNTAPNDKARNTAALRLAVAFSQIVALLMPSPRHKHFSLADLEWLVVPALTSGQYAVAEAKIKDRLSVPAAAVLWASVSPEVDKRLSEALNSPIRLQPAEWKSGDILWLVEA